jgi:hypothetical protein
MGQAAVLDHLVDRNDDVRFRELGLRIRKAKVAKTFPEPIVPSAVFLSPAQGFGFQVVSSSTISLA